MQDTIRAELDMLPPSAASIPAIKSNCVLGCLYKKLVSRTRDVISPPDVALRRWDLKSPVQFQGSGARDRLTN